MTFLASANLLRRRDGHEARVTFVELFFDLVYVFAVTQISHSLLHDLTLMGALHALVLWFAVWLGWQYTCWVTNWFDPDAVPMRVMLFAVMLAGLVSGAALPGAFGATGLVFAISYVVIQVGRTLFIVLHLGPSHPLSPNFRRMLAWLCVSAVLWIAGGLSQDDTRLALWALAVACEYLSPMIGFRFPGLGRSATREWTIEGGHLAERCQLFVIVALGETLLITGATLAGLDNWHAPALIALLAAFLGTAAMWWVYFDTSSHDGTEAIVHSDDPGRIGAWFHYVHVILIAGVIVSAVANELVILHPDGRIAMPAAAALIGGPALYLAGNGIYKTVVYGRFPLSHVVGLLLLAVLAPIAFVTDNLMVGGLTTLIMILVAAWESVARRKARAAARTEPGRAPRSAGRGPLREHLAHGLGRPLHHRHGAQQIIQHHPRRRRMAGHGRHHAVFLVAHRYRHRAHAAHELLVVDADAARGQALQLFLQLLGPGQRARRVARERQPSHHARAFQPAHRGQEQLAAGGAVHGHVAAHREDQPQRLGGFDALHVDDAVAVRRGQVAGLSQRAGQLRQHRAAGARVGRGAQRGQRQRAGLRPRHVAALDRRGGDEAGALHRGQQPHQGGLGHGQTLRQLGQRGRMLGPPDGPAHAGRAGCAPPPAATRRPRPGRPGCRHRRRPAMLHCDFETEAPCSVPFPAPRADCAWPGARAS